MAKSKSLRINLGSGLDYIPGWVNVDIMPSYKPDVLADVTQPLPFKDSSASEIKAYDILEHLTLEDGEKFLVECRRILEIGGKLHLRVPHVKAIWKKFHHDEEVMLHYIYGNTAETGIFGAHKAGYTMKLLRGILVSCGYEKIFHVEEGTNYVIEAVKAANLLKLKIGIIQQSPDMGGAEKYMLDLVEQWRLAGQSIFVATSGEKYATLLRKLRISVQKYSTIVDVIGDWKGLIKTILTLPYSWFVYARILINFKRLGVQVVLMSEFSERLIVAPVAWFIHMKIVWVEYARPVDSFARMSPWAKILFRLTKNIPEAVVTPTEYVKKSLMYDGRVSQAKIHVIPCGTHVENPLKFHVDKQNSTILVVSRLTREKGQEYVIEALTHVRKKVDARVILVGTGPDEAYFRKVAARSGVTDFVEFAGFVPNLEPYYAQADVCVFPSVWDLEGFGLVQIEAMARGIPVIASDTGPVSEVVQDAAILVEPANSNELAKALINILTNAQLHKEMSTKGHLLVRERYDITRVAQKFLHVLRRIGL